MKNDNIERPFIKEKVSSARLKASRRALEENLKDSFIGIVAVEIVWQLIYWLGFMFIGYEIVRWTVYFNVADAMISPAMSVGIWAIVIQSTWSIWVIGMIICIFIGIWVGNN